MQNNPEKNEAHDPAMFGNTIPNTAKVGEENITDGEYVSDLGKLPQDMIEATGDALILSDALHSIADSIKALSESLLAHTAATNRLADVQERIVAGETTMADEFGIPTHLGQTL